MRKFGEIKALQIIDKEISDLYFLFRARYFENTSYSDVYNFHAFRHLITAISTIKLSNLNWQLLYQTAKSNEANSVKNMQLKMLIHFIYYVIDQDLYVSDDMLQFIENREHIMKTVDLGKKYRPIVFAKENSCPSSVVFWSNNKEDVVEIINCKKIFLLNLFKDYINSTTAKDACTIRATISAFSFFEESIHPLTIENINDFNDEVFFKCLINTERHFKSKGGRCVSSRVLSFFQWLLTNITDEKASMNFDCVNTVVLAYYKLTSRLMSGYIVAKYSPYEMPKYHDRMLLLPTSDDFHITGESYRVYAFDISEIRNPKLRKWYTDFYWKGIRFNLDSRTKKLLTIRNFLKYLDNMSNRSAGDIKITETDIANYIISEKKRNTSVVSTAHNFGIMKSFLLFLEAEKELIIKPISYQMLIYKDDTSDLHKEAYTADELNTIIKYLSSKNPLFQLIISILSKSELRLNSILNLKVGCLQQTLNRKGKSEYSISVHSKRSGNEEESININQYVKTYIEEATKLTEKDRQRMNSFDKDYIFIYTDDQKTIPRRLSNNTITNQMRVACRKLGIGYKSTIGIRNFYMQSVSNYVSNKNYNPAIISKLTGHTLKRHVKNYDEIDIINFCEKYYFVNIGNVYLNGTVIRETSIEHENRVVNGCGYCSEKHCILDGKLDCFVCRSFVTTISCIPFFENEIEKINRRIIFQTISHEKDFLLSKKKLLVGYLSCLLTIKDKEVSVDEQSNDRDNRS